MSNSNIRGAFKCCIIQPEICMCTFITRSGSLPSDSESADHILGGSSSHTHSSKPSNHHRKSSSLDSAKVLADTLGGAAHEQCNNLSKCDSGKPAKVKSLVRERYQSCLSLSLSGALN